MRARPRAGFSTIDEVGKLLGRAWQDVYRELDVAARTGWSEARFVDIVISIGRRSSSAGGLSRPALWRARPIWSGPLRSSGFRLGLVTGSTRREVDATLGPLDLLRCFAVVVTAEDYREGKPAPDCYRSALAGARCGAAAGRSRSRTAGRVWRRLEPQACESSARALPTVEDQLSHQDLSAADLVVPGSRSCRLARLGRDRARGIGATPPSVVLGH